MNCETTVQALDAYLDEELPDATRAELETHLAGCDACRSEADALRSLVRQAAGLPREVAPRRELWPEIAPRLRRRGFTLSPVALAAAAAVLVALSSTLTLMLTRPDTTPATAPVGVIVPAALTLGEGVLEAEAEYERATATLLAALDARRENLSETTLVSVEENLRDIDVALREIRDALREDPSNHDLVRLLGSAHRKKIEMLARVVRHSPALS